MHEWPLLIFTLAVPAAVGAIIFFWFFQGRQAKKGENIVPMMKTPLLVVAILSVLGLLGAFFHLGKPSHAFYAIIGLGRSWQSNEIVVTGVFIALICILAGLAWKTNRVNSTLLLVTGIVGLLDVYCMGRTYAVTLVNGWDYLNTYVVFFGTVFTIGPAIGASFLVSTQNAENKNSLVKTAFVFAIFGILLQTIGAAAFNTAMPVIEQLGATSIAGHLESYTSLIVLRWVLEGIGLALLGIVAFALLKRSNNVIVYAVLGVFVLAEGMSRYVFYVMGS